MTAIAERLRDPDVARARLATLPTPLERGPVLPAGAGDAAGPRLWVKRDDLTGLGGGGNKARKLEFICGAAVESGVDALVTVGAAQSNHCRMTAAAGARLGLDVHLVVSGDQPAGLTGNQLLSALFGAQVHFTGADPRHWGELEIAREQLTDELSAQGVRVASIPIGGSTAVGTVGYAVAFAELIDQCRATGFMPAAVVTTSSSGGTHAGLLAGRAAMIAAGELTAGEAPDVVAVGVAQGVIRGLPDVAELADAALDVVGLGPSSAAGVSVAADDVETDGDWIGDDYAVPTAAADDAIRWAATHAGWLTDRVYTGKGLAGLLGLSSSGRWDAAADVVFLHTGGWPALFAPDGLPD